MHYTELIADGLDPDDVMAVMARHRLRPNMTSEQAVLVRAEAVERAAVIAEILSPGGR